MIQRADGAANPGQGQVRQKHSRENTVISLGRWRATA